MSPEICSHEDVRSKTHEGNAADQHCYCMLTVLFVHSATSGFFQRVFFICSHHSCLEERVKAPLYLKSII